MRRSSAFLVAILLAACTVPPATRVPATPTTASGLQSTNASQTTPIPTAAGILPTDTQATVEATAAVEATATPPPRLEAGTPVALASIHMVDPDIGWGIEKSGHVVRTRDGGNAWQDVTSPQGLFNKDGFFALDANMAWATPRPSDACEDSRMAWSEYQACMPGPNVVIWRTVDGGRSWQAGEPYASKEGHYKPIALQFIDASVGWFLYVSSFGPMGAATMGMAKTENGGISWAHAAAPQSVCIHRAMIFISAWDGWSGADCRFTPTVGWPLQDFINGKSASGLGPLAPVLSRTTDGSLSWADNTLPSPQVFPDELTSPTADPSISILCGTTAMERISSEAFTLQWTCSNEIGTPPITDFSYQYLTSDSGQTWHSWLSTGNEFFLNARMGWRLDSTGQSPVGRLQQTTDGGQTWTTIKTVTWQSAQFDFVSEQVGWAIVTTGDSTSALVHTQDGGKTWEEIRPKTTVLAAMFRSNPERTGVYGEDNAAIVGELQWKFKVGAPVFGSPAFSDGTIFIGSRDQVHAVDAQSGQEKWKFTMDPCQYCILSSATVANGTLYLGNGKDYFYALDATSGRVKWKFQTEVSESYSFSSPAAVSESGVVYFGSPWGLHALDAETGQLIWEYRTGGGAPSSPCIVDGTVYFGANNSYLYALNARTGRLKWKFWIDFGTSSAPVVSQGIVYVGGSWDGDLYAIDAESGVLKWKFEGWNYVYASPALWEGVVYYGTDLGYFYAVDAQTGQLLWQFYADFSIASAPAISNGTVYFGSWNKYFYAVNAKTGEEIWKFQTGDAIQSSPIIANGMVYIGSNDGYLYAFR